MSTILAPLQNESEGMRALQRQRDNPGLGDVYFSADVETDGPIPGPYSMLSFALVYSGSFDGKQFKHPKNFEKNFYRELRPVSENFQPEALRVNWLDRDRLRRKGEAPEHAMSEAGEWITRLEGCSKPAL